MYHFFSGKKQCEMITINNNQGSKLSYFYNVGSKCHLLSLVAYMLYENMCLRN